MFSGSRTGSIVGFSAFFSASEAALFSLRPDHRRGLATGTPGQRVAGQLLKDPERLLSAVLFWNLVVNIVYFAIASIVEHKLPDESAWVWPLRLGSLLLIIFCSEMLPKTLAVLMSQKLATMLSIPLSIMVQATSPVMPLFRAIMVVSRRLFWPEFEPEDSLAATDLERAIELSTTDAKLLDQERTILRNIVSLSNLRVDESMRPRTRIQTFQPPLRWEVLQGGMPPSGYLFLTEIDSENVAAAVRLPRLCSVEQSDLEAAALPVVYVPWCSSVADALAQLRASDREAAAIVNEWGETIGVLTIDDILDVVFKQNTSRSHRLLNQEPIEMVHHGLWKATGMTNLRRLEEYFQRELPPTHNATIGGVVQESLQRVPQTADRCAWGPFDFEVIELGPEGQMTLHVRLSESEEEA